MTRLLAVVAAALALVLLPATAALATYRATATGATTVTAATLAPPTGLTNTSSCNVVTQNVAVAWTASTSARATGYLVTMTVNGTSTDYPVATTSFSRFMLLGAGKSYTVAVRTVLGNWTSAAPSVSFTC